MRELEFFITEKDNGKPIRDFLKGFGFSSSLITGLKQNENGIKKNGKFAKAIEILNTGDILSIRIENKGKKPTPVKMDIEILYEDEDIIVFNKPYGIPVHESRNHQGDTLSNFFAYHINEDTAFRAVFRLDRDTSGAVLVAKNELAASKLAGKIKKDYYAIIQGKMSGNGEIDEPIARCSDSIIKRKVSNDGERAITQYFTISSTEKASLIKFNLLTGRTHQIRVHMEHAGHPLLGDELYSGSTEYISRQALHCRDIYFLHPITNEKMHIFCDYSEDIKEVIKCLHL